MERPNTYFRFSEGVCEHFNMEAFKDLCFKNGYIPFDKGNEVEIEYCKRKLTFGFVIKKVNIDCGPYVYGRVSASNYSKAKEFTLKLLQDMPPCKQPECNNARNKERPGRCEWPECIICMSSYADVAYDCGHVVSCANCEMQSHAHSSTRTCPLCRAPITKPRRLYLWGVDLLHQETLAVIFRFAADSGE